MPDSNIFERRQGNHNSFHSFIYLTVLIIMASLPIVQTCQFKPRKGLRTPCSESIKTVVEVRSCPTSKESWAERALIKDCSKFLHNCSEGDPLIYHCVLDEDGKRLLEVCALMTQIKGRRCAEFNSGGMFVQEHLEKKCKECQEEKEEDAGHNDSGLGKSMIDSPNKSNS
ncbi:uncharacterized protein LOC134241598 [Saccostrea cucullata]|uniref:uncharacterized protein LOC134241598 n=1 Tax=Saccostrea cuccullata TaxID=36930 RepID=UPI002ED40E06